MSSWMERHNRTIAALLRQEAAAMPEWSDSRRHYAEQAYRYEVAGDREVAPAYPVAAKSAE